MVYSTPGLQAGRSSFTTASEIHGWLRDQALAATRTVGLQAAVRPYGRSQDGQTLEALVLTSAAGTDAAALRASARPTVLLLAQQHGNEPAGSEALLVIASELAQGLLQPLLERINVVIVARANPDGAARDQRASSDGRDINRDHLLLATPEAQALAALVRDLHPAVIVDLHEYPVTGPFMDRFDAVPKFDALLHYASTANLPEFLTKAQEEWYRQPMLAALARQGLSTEWYYRTPGDTADRKVFMGDALPENARNVYGLKNSISLLLATRGVGIGRLQLQRRVHTHVTAITSVLASTAQRAAELGQLLPYLDKEVSELACKDQAIIETAPTATQYALQMLDRISGADKSVMVEWQSSLVLRTVKVRARPCGYWLSADSSLAIERLRLHGVQVLRVAEAGAVLGDAYLESASSPSEGRARVQLALGLSRGLVDVPRGSYYVPLNQPLANLVVAALEPDTPSSFFANRVLEALPGTVRVMTPPLLKLEELP